MKRRKRKKFFSSSPQGYCGLCNGYDYKMRMEKKSIIHLKIKCIDPINDKYNSIKFCKAKIAQDP